MTSQVDSRVILDQPGAESLLGKGDTLWMAPDKPFVERLQGAFVSDTDVEQLVDFWKGQRGGAIKGGPGSQLALPGVLMEAPPAKRQDGSDKALKEKAVKIAQEEGSISVSLLQRRLRIGYNRAGRIVDKMEIERILMKEGDRRVLAE